MSTPHTPTKAKPSASGQAYKSTPVKKSLQGSEHYASLSKPDAELLKKNMASELAGQWVGPMPVEDFISTFLPTSSAIPKFDPNFFDVLAKQSYESAMYDPFIKHLTTKAPKVINGFKLINTSQYEDEDIDIPGMKNKPDVSCYKKTCSVDPAHPTRYEDIELIFEFKPARDQANPFVDRPTKTDMANRFPFETQGESGRQCRGQIASYARVWCARQHRTHCFIVWMGDPLARIIRFDRSGGIVSEQFNYRTNGDLLLNFLWSFSHNNDGARGLDPTVTKASPTEAERVRLELFDWKPSSYRSVFKVQVPDADPDPKGDKKRTRPFFVWGPLADPRSVTGRATRGYPAWDPNGDGGKGRVVFLKDSWRSCEPGMEKEVDILGELNRNQCRNVPTLVCGDDLDNQTTLTKKYANEPWNIGAKVDKFVQRVHTRFVERDVGSHLTSGLEMGSNSMYSKKFLQIIFDAFIAHYDAYVKCGILHRDISAGNILVNKQGGGFLNDWDLSKHVNSDNVARQVFRSGTWQFMSAELLMDPTKVNALQHDLESFFWVVVFHILRYMRTNVPREKLEDKMKSIFDFQIDVQCGELPEGGHVKGSMFTTINPLGDDFEITDNIPLITFFREALQHWKQWYQYPSSRQFLIDYISTTQNISKDEASKMYPDTSNNLAMSSHRIMIQLFKAALAKGTPWPQADLFVDRLADPQKRERDEGDEQNQSAAGEDTGKGKGTPSETGRPKKNMKLNDDADYKGRGPVKPLPPPGTRQQTRLREMGSSGSHQP